MLYHAHVYWQNESQHSEALQLRQKLVNLGCEVGTMHDRPIGPHPLPSYQVNYSSNNADAVEFVLASTSLDILLHEDTGDDMRDHTTGARWLGNELKLDLVWLTNYMKNKNG